MRNIQLCLLICISAFSIACPSKPSTSMDKNNSLVSHVNAYLKEQQLRYECARQDKGYIVPAKGAVAGNVCEETISNGTALAKAIRNEAIEDALAVIDDNYVGFINSLDTRRSNLSFIADVIDLGTGVATGVSKSNLGRANQVLGIALTGFRGSRQSFDLNYYKQQTTPILIAKMDDNRQKVYAGILTKQAKEIDEYSMRSAIRDIVAYYNAGTLIRAFTELAKDTSAQAKESERMVRVLKGENIEISNIPTIERENLSDASFVQRRSLAQQLLNAQEAANSIPIPTATNPATPTEAERAAIEKATADRVAKLKPIRLKLEAIWNEVEAQDKLAAAVKEMNTEDRFADILTKRQNAPTTVTEDDYLKLINRLTAKIKENTELSKEFLAILRKANK